MDRAFLPAVHVVRVCLFLWTFCCLWDCSVSPLCAEESVKGAARLEAYILQHKTAEDVEHLLTQLLADQGNQVQIIPDPKRNQILVKGPAKAHEITKQLLKSVDKPAEIRRAESGRPVLKMYPCDASESRELAKHLQARWGSTPNVRVAVDSSGERVMIVAPPEVHTKIVAELSPESSAVVNSTSDAGAVKTASTEEVMEEDDHVPQTVLRPRIEFSEAAPAPYARGKRVEGIVSEVATRSVELQQAKVNDVSRTLRELLKARIASTEESGTFELKNANGDVIRVIPEFAQNRFQLQGDQAFAEQVEKLIRMFDPIGATAETKTKVMPLKGVDPKKVQEAVEAYRQHQPHPGKKPGEGDQSNFETPFSTEISMGPEKAKGPTPFKLVAFQPGGDLGGVGGDAGGPMIGGDDALNGRLKNIGVDVQVETLPDLDVIILRGNERDVQEMTKILEEIERISQETEPTIEVYNLKHVDSQSLATLIQRTNNDLVGWRQGKVSVTPLVKPNALMLIGWGEAVKAVRDLIVKLDQPLPADSEFQVFSLKHSGVAAAQRTLTEYFATRPGLNGSVQVIADSRTNALIVQAPPREMQEVIKLIEQIDAPESKAVNQARVVKLKNTLATDLAPVLASAIQAAQGGAGTGANSQKSAVLELLTIDANGEKILKSGMLSDVKITPDARTNTLVVSAPAESLELVLALIAQLDNLPPDVAQIKVFRILNGDVRSLSMMLRSLFPAPDVPGGQANLSSAVGESTLIPLRFSVDLRTNSIIATGSSGDLRIVEALLLRLDEKDVKQRKTHVYRLKNTPVAEVAKAVSEMLQREREIEQIQAGGFAGMQQIENEVVVVAEEIGNNLIISASPRYFDDIKELVEKLDAEPPEVLIQVLIAEVALNNTDEFGIELGLQDSILFDRSLLGNLVTNGSTIVGASNTPGFNFNNQALGNSGAPSSLATSNKVAGQGLSNFNVGRTNSDLGFGGLVLSASSESVSVLIRALQESRRLEVLSRPQLRTLDNQPGFVQVGQRVPTIQNTSLNSFGQTNSVILENVGLILGVTPRISPEGMVVMELDAEKSDIDETSQGIPISISADGQAIYSPIFNVTQASTTVSAGDGETIIIGGLITKSNNTVHRRIPYLSDVPLLGNMFRYDSVVDRRTELLIILTPHVIRNPLDAERLKQIEAARMHWTAADVVDFTGDPTLMAEADSSKILDIDTQVIYPDNNPRGEWICPEPTTGELLTAPPSDELPPPLYESGTATSESSDGAVQPQPATPEVLNPGADIPGAGGILPQSGGGTANGAVGPDLGKKYRSGGIQQTGGLMPEKTTSMGGGGKSSVQNSSPNKTLFPKLSSPQRKTTTESSGKWRPMWKKASSDTK